MNKVLIIMISLIMFLVSCKNQPQIKFEELSDSDYITLDSILEAKEDTSVFGTAGSARNIKSAFLAAFRSCQKSDDFKKGIYLGPSNKKYLGVILSKDLTIQKRDFLRLVDTNIFKRFVTFNGPIKGCDLNKVSGIDFSAFFDDNVLSPNDTLIKFVLEHADSTSISQGKWTIHQLVSKEFLDFIEESNDPKISKYRNDLFDKDNVVITKVLEISNFNGYIYSENGFGVTGNVSIPQEMVAIDEFDVGLKLKTIDTKTIKISSEGSFYVFVSVDKAVKL